MRSIAHRTNTAFCAFMFKEGLESVRIQNKYSYILYSVVSDLHTGSIRGTRQCLQSTPYLSSICGSSPSQVQVARFLYAAWPPSALLGTTWTAYLKGTVNKSWLCELMHSAQGDKLLAADCARWPPHPVRVQRKGLKTDKNRKWMVRISVAFQLQCEKALSLQNSA